MIFRKKIIFKLLSCPLKLNALLSPISFAGVIFFVLLDFIGFWNPIICCISPMISVKLVQIKQKSFLRTHKSALFWQSYAFCAFLFCQKMAQKCQIVEFWTNFRAIQNNIISRCILILVFFLKFFWICFKLIHIRQ